MSDSIITVEIICPAPIEYQTCHDLLKLSDEIELRGRLVSSWSGKGIKNVICKNELLDCF